MDTPLNGDVLKGQAYMVLSDGESFGSADGSFILLAPPIALMTEEELSELEDGRLPDASEDWPSINIMFNDKGDLVAVTHGVAERRVVVLLRKEQF